jgi:3-deoxy-D-manno-octulosonic acid (KDO) 8-phosphate synthase
MTAPNALQTEALQAIQDNGGKHNLSRFRRATKDKLVRAGWATRVDGLFQLTENGRQVIAAPAR